MKTLFFTTLILAIFGGCASDTVQINNIPDKTTFVKAEKPSGPSSRSGYWGGHYYGYYGLGNGPLTYQGSPEDVDNMVRGID